MLLSVWQTGLTSAGNPSIDVEKYVSTNGRDWEDADDPTGPRLLIGEDVWFKFEVTNASDVRLTHITLEDTKFELDVCELPNELAPGESVTCTLGPIPAEEGQHTATAAASASGVDGEDIYDDTDDANYFGVSPSPSIHVEKYVSRNGQTWRDADAPTGPRVSVGANVWFKLVVTNDGNTHLTNVALEDSDYLVSECALPAELVPDETFACLSGPFVAEKGQYVGSASVHGDYAGATLSDQDAAHYFGAAPSLDLEKYISTDGQNWEDADVPTGPQVLAGRDVWLKLVVVNDGNVTLANLDLADSDLDLIGCEIPVELPPAELFECVIGSLVAEVGQHTNTASASGDFAGESYADEDDVNYRGLALPRIDVKEFISVDGQNWRDADSPTGLHLLIGEGVWFKFVVTNKGNVTLADVGLGDDYFNVSSCGLPNVLAPQASFTCVIGPFSAEAGQHTNTATTRASYNGQMYTDSNTVHYFGAAPSIHNKRPVPPDGRCWGGVPQFP
jgi:hypothetical protein